MSVAESLTACEPIHSTVNMTVGSVVALCNRNRYRTGDRSAGRIRCGRGDMGDSIRPLFGFVVPPLVSDQKFERQKYSRCRLLTKTPVKSFLIGKMQYKILSAEMSGVPNDCNPICVSCILPYTYVLFVGKSMFY